MFKLTQEKNNKENKEVLPFHYHFYLYHTKNKKNKK